MKEKMKKKNIRGTMKILFFAFLITLITSCEERFEPNQPPTVSITSGPSGTITINQATFSWSGSDSDGSISGYYYDLDDPTPDNWTESTSKHYSNLLNGQHTFYVKAKDNDSDYSSVASRSFTVSVDTTPPNTTITSGPSGTIDYDDVSFTWTGTDIVTQTQNLVYSYKLEGLEGYENNWSDFTSSTSNNYNNLPDSSYTFYVKAKDEAGNEDPTPASRSFTVDTEVNPGSVVGYVYESGGGVIENAWVKLYTSAGSYTGKSDYTPSTGYFEITSVDPANYYLIITKSGYYDKRDPSSGTFTVSDGETENRGTIYMTEEVNPGSVVGYVYESGGGAIYNAFVRLYKSDGSYTGKSDYTPSTGYFEITSVDPANYYLIITKSGYYDKRDPSSGTFTVSDGETENRGTIYMTEEVNPGSVVGYVYESGGGAIYNAFVKLYTSSGSYTGKHYYTSLNGYFQITSVDPDNYYLMITKSGYYDKRDPSSGTFTVSDDETENRGTIYMTEATEEVYIWIYYNFINHITMFVSNHPYYSGHRLIYNGGYSYAWENSCSLDGEFLWLNPDLLLSYIYLFDPGNDGIYISDNTSSITVEWKAGEKYGESGPLGFVTSENPSCHPDGNNSIWSGNPGCNSYEKTFSECVPTGSEVKLKIGLEGLWLSGAIAFKEIKLTFHGWEVPARSYTVSRHLVEDKVINQSESK